MATNRAMQAVSGIDVVAAGGIVRVKDGDDTWLALESSYDAAYEHLERSKPIDGDEGGALAYSELCGSVAAPIASVNGSCRGEWRQLVRDAVSAGLIDEVSARRMYGVSLADLEAQS